MSKNSILVVGSLAFDSVKTPSGHVDRALGGSANYFSVAASFFTPVKVVAVVGRDFPEQHLSALKKRKVDVSGVDVVNGETFRWAGEYMDSLNEAKTLSTQLNVFEHFNPKLQNGHRECPYVFLGNIDPVLQAQVVDQVKKPKLVACDTMNFWISGKPGELKTTLSKIDLLSVNEGEARLLSGESHLSDAAKKIRSMGPKVIIIKRGEYGAAVFTPKSTFVVPAFMDAKVVDPTGAGDSFAGAMMGTLASEGADPKNLGKFEKILRKGIIAGCVMASFTIEDFSLNRILKLKAPELKSRERLFRQMIGAS